MKNRNKDLNILKSKLNKWVDIIESKNLII